MGARDRDRYKGALYGGNSRQGIGARGRDRDR